MAGHVAIVTGANHGIGAATSMLWRDVAVRCCAPSCGVDDPADPGTPQAYRDQRAQDAGPIVAQIRADGGRAVAVEADLSDPATPAMLFDTAEEQLGPVDILVNNATGWLADTFAPVGHRPAWPITPAGDGRNLEPAVHGGRDGRGSDDQ